MKKNKWMRLASVMLVLCLITTCTVSGTYAKYVSADNAVDTARVAKWGVNVVAGGTLFSNAYYEQTHNTPAVWEQAAIDALKFTVATADKDGDNLVAPGTKSAGDGMIFGLGGVPEVALNLVIEVEGKDVMLEHGDWAYLTPIELDAGTFATTLAECDTSIAAASFAHKLYVADGDKYVEVAPDATFIGGADYYLATVCTVDERYFPVQYTNNSSDGDTANKTIAYQIVKELADLWESDLGFAVTWNSAEVYDAGIELDVDLPANYDLSQFGLCSDANGTPMSLTWEWEFYVDDDTDCADTILGDLMRQFKDGLPSGDLIIFDGYEVSIDGDGLASTDEEARAAFLFTGFDVSIEATQID